MQLANNMTLQQITEKLKQDKRNKDYTDRGIAPIFQINEQAKLLIIGQAPGKKAEESQIPFHDKSGENLIGWLSIDRDTFYSPVVAIMPMDFYYPGKGKSGDLPPRPFIAEEYHSAMLKQMPEIRLTLLIGQYSTKYYLKDKAQRNLTETVRHYREYLPAFFPLVHPSPLNFRWQAKNPWFEKEVVPELQKIVQSIISSQ